MTLDEVQGLQPGDEVYWSDPNEGAKSRVVRIQTIEVYDSLVVIREPDGATLECFASELS